MNFYRVAPFACLMLFWGVLLWVLAGCSAVPCPPPAIQVQTVTVKVPVSVPCITKGDIPPEPPHVANQLTGQAGHDLLIVDQSALDLRTWGEGVAAQATACAAPVGMPGG